MNKFSTVFAFAAVCLVSCIGSASSQEPPAFWCRNDNQNVCRFNNVQRTAEDPYWRPAAENSANVKKIAFDSSTMPVFTDDICKAFPNLEEIVARSAEVEEFIENAFSKCPNLKVLDFYTNHIKNIDESTFRYNENLQVVRLDSNKLETLPTNVFVNQVNLKTLYLGDNQLGAFPAYLLQRNEKLELLFIHSNHLLDLDYKKLVEYLPNLKSIDYNANQFSCAHVTEMNNAFKAIGVSVGTTSVARTRFYPQIRVGNVLCSEDVSWSSSYYRTAFNTLDDADNLLYTKKEVKDLINVAIEESNAELKKELENLRLLIKAISAKF